MLVRPTKVPSLVVNLTMRFERAVGAFSVGSKVIVNDAFEPTVRPSRSPLQDTSQPETGSPSSSSTRTSQDTSSGRFPVLATSTVMLSGS